MEDQVHPLVFLRGDPTEQEMVAISGAYRALLHTLVDKTGENDVDFFNLWVFSTKNTMDDQVKNINLAGKMASWQQNLRVRSRV